MSTIKTDETIEHTNPATTAETTVQPELETQEAAAGNEALETDAPVTAADIDDAADAAETTDQAEETVTAADIQDAETAERTSETPADGPVIIEAADDHSGPHDADLGVEPQATVTALVPIEDPSSEKGAATDADATESGATAAAHPSMLARAVDRIPTNGLLLLSALIVWSAVYISYIR